MSKIKMQIEAVSSLNVQSLAMIVLAPHPESSFKSSLKLPIKVGSGDATMLCNQLAKQNMRPSTHTLLSRIIEETGYEVESVCINNVKGSLFFADITLIDSEGQTHILDARPSDALSLAATVLCPIYCTDEVLTAAGMPDFREIKDSVDCDKALSDLVEQDLLREFEESKNKQNKDIQEVANEKYDFLNKLNAIELRSGEIEIIDDYKNITDEDSDDNLIQHPEDI